METLWTNIFLKGLVFFRNSNVSAFSLCLLYIKPNRFILFDHLTCDIHRMFYDCDCHWIVIVIIWNQPWATVPVVPIPRLVVHSRLDYLRRGTQIPEELTLTEAKAKKYYITGATSESDRRSSISK